MSADQRQPGGSSRGSEGQASGFTCPECFGSLWENWGGGVDEPADTAPAGTAGGGAGSEGREFECRVGHRFQGKQLAEEQLGRAEASVWAAVSTMEERAALLRREAMRAEEHGQEPVASWYRQQATDALRHAASLRETVLGIIRSQREEAPENEAA